MKTLKLVIAAATLFCSSAFAEQTLSNENSRISFLSVKKGTVAEVHHFKHLTGQIADNGDIQVNIDLSSVETNIPIRNERMLKHLFEVARFPAASISVAPTELPKAGESRVISSSATLELHGVKKSIPFQALIVNAGNELVISSLQPVVISAADFGLDAGIEALKTIAKLPSITHAVPVSFVLTFK